MLSVILSRRASAPQPVQDDFGRTLDISSWKQKKVVEHGEIGSGTIWMCIVQGVVPNNAFEHP